MKRFILTGGALLAMSLAGCTANLESSDPENVEGTSEALIRPGECICTDVYLPVCGRNGQTYSNGCYAFCAGTEVAFTGECGTGVPEERVTADLNNCSLFGLRPFPSEDGHLSAVRLPVDDAPFKVTSIEYSLIDTAGVPGCDASIPQQISLWVQDNSFPDATPELLYTTNFTPTPTPGAPNSFFQVPLFQPIVVDVGESLFISWSMTYNSSTSASCVLSCSGAVVPETGFWSNSPTTPYPWSDLLDFGLDTIPLVFVDGERLSPGAGSAF